MPSPLLYDIRRVLTSKSVLILMAVMILLSFALVSTFSISTTNPGASQLNTQVLSWYDSGATYHFLAFAWNANGQPVSGVAFQLNLTTVQSNSSSPFGSCPSHYVSSESTTDASGKASFSISAPINAAYSACFAYTASNGISLVAGPFSTPYASFVVNKLNGSSSAELVPPGEIVGIGNGAGGNPIQTVYLNNNFAQQALILNWAGQYGTPPTNYPIYYKFYNATQQCISSGNSISCSSNFNYQLLQSLGENSMTYLGNMSGYLQSLTLPALPSHIQANSSTLALGVFFPNGTSIGPVSAFQTDSLYVQQSNQVSVSQANNIVFGFFQGIFALFIPLVAILGSYNSYGKDRTSGVLESVLAQPISRRSLSLSRFISTFSAMAIATSIAMGVVDAIYHFYTGAFFDANLLLISAGSFFVELAAFIALMMLLARVIKSSGLLVGVGIGLFLLFALFWGIVILLVELAMNPSGFGSSGYDQISVIGEFLNPAQFFSLVDTYVTHTVSIGGIFGGGFGIPISPSAYGVTIYSIVAAAILWVGVPLAGFLYLAVKKD